MKEIFLKNYSPVNFTIKKISLSFLLDKTETIVEQKSAYIMNPNESCLELDGVELELLDIKVDGVNLSKDSYTVSDDRLKIINLPQEFELYIKTKINPLSNKTLEGLYISNDFFCTQCEAEGFRKITYFADRPDVMTTYDVKIVATDDFPVLLSNGNLIDSGRVDDKYHFACWSDPSKKPCYLFALVGGRLDVIEDSFKTMNNKVVDLFVYTDPGKSSRAKYAMESLKNAMKWDETKFGFEYDLDRYMVVAVDSFNMGAMENKGLNIFNSAYVMADFDTATDSDYHGIESVIGHEYFHNWTGNRITCRDWFQLTLKEGLTVYRDQEFSADMNSRSVERLTQVDRLKQNQFVEDSGPTRHPIRPEKYIEINNFYSQTIYEKGAEVIRMLENLFGKDGFRKGIELYVKRHDGQAATVEDFLQSFSDANNYDLFEHFFKWYSTSGTPVLNVTKELVEGGVKVNFTQTIMDTPEGKKQDPLLIPIRIGVLDENGVEQVSELLILKKSSDSFVLKGSFKEAHLSINRGFMAPVKVIESEPSLVILAKSDTDLFNRYLSFKTLSKNAVLSAIKGEDVVTPLSLLSSVVESYLDNPSLDKSFLAKSLSFIDANEVQSELNYFEPKLVQDSVLKVKYVIADKFKIKLLNILESIDSLANERSLSKDVISARALKCSIISLLSTLKTEEISEFVKSEYFKSTTMTVAISMLRCAVTNSLTSMNEISDHFYNKWKSETLVIQKWFLVHSQGTKENAITKMRSLEKLPEYSDEVPNLLRAVSVGFSRTNFVGLFEKPEEGIEYLMEKLEKIDSINPRMSPAFMYPFKLAKKLPENIRGLLKIELEKMVKRDVSKDLFEVAGACLKEL